MKRWRSVSGPLSESAAHNRKTEAGEEKRYVHSTEENESEGKHVKSRQDTTRREDRMAKGSEV